MHYICDPGRQQFVRIQGCDSITYILELPTHNNSKVAHSVHMRRSPIMISTQPPARAERPRMRARRAGWGNNHIINWRQYCTI